MQKYKKYKNITTINYKKCKQQSQTLNTIKLQ